MRVPGRFWWVAALAACASGAGAVVVVFIGLTGNVARDAAEGNSIGPDIAFLITGSVMCLGFSGILVWYAARLLARYRSRRRALRGDMGAMPLASATLPPAAIPDPIAEPLTLRWRMNRVIIVFESMIIGLKLLFPLGLGGAVLYFTWKSLQHPEPQAPFLGQLLTLVMSLVTIGAICVLACAFVRLRWFQWRHAFGVTAAADGLECIDDSGRRSFIAWGDARLFEVEAHSASVGATHVWRLYSSQDLAEWSYHPLSDGFRPDGVSASEAMRRAHLLVWIVEARTGLQSRTLSKALIAPTAAAPHTPPDP